MQNYTFTEEDRMNIHKNAALTRKNRAEVAKAIASGRSKADVARAFCICAKTAAKWFKRFQSGGEAALSGLSGILCARP